MLESITNAQALTCKSDYNILKLIKHALFYCCKDLLFF